MYMVKLKCTYDPLMLLRQYFTIISVDSNLTSCVTNVAEENLHGKCMQFQPMCLNCVDLHDNICACI